MNHEVRQYSGPAEMGQVLEGVLADGNYSPVQASAMRQLFSQLEGSLLRAQTPISAQKQDQIGLSSPGVPGIVGYQYVSVGFLALTAAGGTATTTFKNPIGTQWLPIMLFDPAIDIRITLTPQHSRNNILQGFSTKIGNVGLIYLSNMVESTDIITIQVVNQDTNPQSPVFTFGFA